MLFYTMEMNGDQGSNYIKHPKSRPYDFRGIEMRIDYSWGAFLSFLELDNLDNFVLLYGKELSSMNISISFLVYERKNMFGSTWARVYVVKMFLMLSSCPFYSYESPDIALNCGIMLRECIRHEPLAKITLCSEQFYDFFRYVEMSTFDIASDAFATFKVSVFVNMQALSVCFVWVGSLIISFSDALYNYYVWWIPFVWFSSRICWRDTNCSALSFWSSTMTEWVTGSSVIGLLSLIVCCFWMRLDLSVILQRVFLRTVGLHLMWKSIQFIHSEVVWILSGPKEYMGTYIWF